GIALAAEPADKENMSRPPRPPKESLFAGGMITKILITGSIMAITAIFTQLWAAKNGYDTASQQTMVFTLLCFIQLGNAFSVRSTYYSIFSRAMLRNRGMWGAVLLSIALQLLIVYVPLFQGIFKTTALDWNAMGTVLVATVLAIAGIEILTFF